MLKSNFDILVNSHITNWCKKNNLDNDYTINLLKKVIADISFTANISIEELEELMEINLRQILKNEL